jgi:hypothetical protein
MRVGICTRYDRDESALTATIFADWLRANGYDVSMFVVPSSVVLSQGNWWDTHHFHGSRVLFSDWVGHRDVVVWMSVPHREQLEYLQKNGIKSFVLYDHYMPFCKEIMTVYSAADFLLVVNRACAYRCMTSAKIGKPFFVPLVPNTPMYDRNRRPGALPTVLWPVFDEDWCRFDSTILLPQMTELLRKFNNMFSLRIVISTYRLPSKMLRTFQTWQKQYDSVSLHTCRNIRWRNLQYQHADIMFWPSYIENAMLRGLHAYSFGVPIVGINANPMSELLAAAPQLSVAVTENNKTRYGYLDTPTQELHEALLERLLAVIQSPDILTSASAGVTRFISSRHKTFEIAMKKLFK